LSETEIETDPATTLGALDAKAFAALEASLDAEVVRRIDLECPNCGKKTKKVARIPAVRERLEAAKWVREQLTGRAAPKRSAEEVGETTVVFRSIHWTESELEPLLYELAEAVISDSYEPSRGKAKEMAAKVYRSCGRFSKDAVRVPDEWDTKDAT
jgi:hypothetical protein